MPPSKPSRSGRRRRQSSPAPTTRKERSPLADTKNPSRIKEPIAEHVHKALKDAWAINNKGMMCFIFDVSYPPRQFKKDSAYDATRLPLEQFKRNEYEDMTESDPESNREVYPGVDLP